MSYLAHAVIFAIIAVVQERGWLWGVVYSELVVGGSNCKAVRTAGSMASLPVRRVVCDAGCGVGHIDYAVYFLVRRLYK